MSPCAMADRRARTAGPGGALLVAAALLVLVGCGGGAAAPTGASTAATASAPSDSASADATDAASPAAVDPCSLITLKEAEAVVGGVTLQAGVPAGNPTPDRCVWTAPPTASIAQVEIDVGDGAKKSYDIDHDVLKHTFTTVPGLGDEAYQEDDAIFFRVGSTWVALHIELLNDPSANVVPMQKLAAAVAGRL